MKKRTKALVIGGSVLALGGAGASYAIATGGDSSQPISGAALDRASRVALADTGGGRVTGSEVGDEESYYEVEVTLDDGDQVDVQLDENFAVVGSTTDSGN
jgi:uncharacterized membrane protein YkoI